MMRRTFISGLLLACFVSITPVAAQPVTPTPRPASSSAELQILNEISQRLQTMSSTSDSTTNAAVLMLGGAFFVLMLAALVVVVWIARGGLVPIWQTITAERQRANQAEQSETRMQLAVVDQERRADEYRSKTAQAMQATAQSQERMANILSTVETSDQASRGRQTAVATITTHVTNDGNLTRNDMKRLEGKLDRALAWMEKGDDPDIAAARQEIIEAREEVVKMGDTGPLDPSKVPDTDPAADSTLKEPDPWQGDHPPNLPPE